MPIVLFALAIAPGLILMWLFFRADRYEREPAGLLWGTFFIGVFMAIPVGIIEGLLKPLVGASGFSHYTGLFVFFYLIVAPVEELAKYFSVRLNAYNSPEFNEVMDGVVYCVAAGAGFATIENVFYVFQYGVGAAVVRAFLSVPGHVFWAAFIGYYMGLAKFDKERESSLILTGLLLAIAFHGTFDFFAMTKSIYVVPLVVPLTIVAFFSVRRQVARALEMSPQKAGGLTVSYLFQPRKQRHPRSRAEIRRVTAWLVMVFAGVMLMVAFSLIFHHEYSSDMGWAVFYYLVLVPLGVGIVLLISAFKSFKVLPGGRA